MAVSDWNTANSERSYPFQKNPEASGLETHEILDARFFIVNSEYEKPSVWLASREETESHKIYTFRTSAFQEGSMSDLVFRVEKKPYAQCIWNTDQESWNGYCVFGGER